MAIAHILTRPISLGRTNNQPNIVTHLITRMGLGLFASVLPLLFFRFMLSFFTTPISQEWQLRWGAYMSSLFLASMLLSTAVALIIFMASYNSEALHKYGRFAGRFCTIALTGLSMSVPYMSVLMTKGNFFLPSFFLACFVPVMTFIVVRSATKDYLLRLRIWFDHNQ